MKCLVVDDDHLTCDLVENYLKQIGGIDYCLKVNDGSTALHLLATEAFDAVFLDLKLPGIDGISLLKALPHHTAVVIISASADFGAESYQFDVVDYLIKPLDFSRFAKAVIKLKNRTATHAPATPDALFIKDSSTIHRIDLADLLCVEAQGNYASFTFAKAKPVMSLLTLQKLETLLPPYFVRIHRSYIVNIHAIRQIDGNQVDLGPGQTKLPIGKSHRDELHEKLKIIN
ncbi:LytTR family DNA-binding domain-containing protein [Verrucomicrobiaceae bacterium 227]